jgi:mannan endo-1,4-beta-mannosidase
MAFNNRGGINAFVWHWNAPTCLYNTAAEPWWSGFYTRATCFDFQEALNEGPNGNNYKLLLRDIDAIATQIGRLRDANIPILFRPLHEPEGGWFWWGTKGSGAFKQLWDLMYNRLTGYHGLHNMIWVCNTANSDWYPGNNKCDIDSVDIYSWAGDHSTQSGQYNTLKSLTQSQKVIALSEVGNIPDPEAQARENIPWAYWVTWAGNFITDGQYNSKSFLQSTFNNQYVTNMDKIGNWRAT